MGIEPFNDEQVRIAINLEQHYEVWIDAERALAALPYGMKWKHINNTDYLYALSDRVGNGKSLGPRSPETEEIYAGYLADKESIGGRCKISSITLNQTCRQYRALMMPLLPSEAAKILREADRRRMLGTDLMVVGTVAMPRSGGGPAHLAGNRRSLPRRTPRWPVDRDEFHRHADV